MLLYRHSHNLNIFRFCFDLLLVLIGWVIAFSIRFESGLVPMPKGTDSWYNYLKLTPVLMIVYALTFFSTGIYRRSLVHRRVWEENFDLFRVHLIGFVIYVTCVYFLFDKRFSRVTLFLFCCLVPVLLPMGRSLIRKFNRVYLRSERKKAGAVIIGEGRQAEVAQNWIEGRQDWNLHLIEKIKLSEKEKISKAFQDEKIDVVFITAAPQEMNEVQNVYANMGTTMAEIYQMLDFGGSTYLAPKTVDVDHHLMVALNASNLEGTGRLSKRIFDIAFSAAFLTVFAPLYLFIAFLVKVTSKGPVFYKQERMGLDGNVFQCLKFRGMYIDAETKSGPVWASKDDPRVTPIGKWLRKTSLDEIPQFINVLRGEMSVVGPRPERPFFVNNFRTQIPGYMLRHKVKSGITGWAQVNGWRGNTSLEKRIECDLWYIQNWSLWLDLKISLLTPFRGLIHPHAY